MDDDDVLDVLVLDSRFKRRRSSVKSFVWSLIWKCMQMGQNKDVNGSNTTFEDLFKKLEAQLEITQNISSLKLPMLKTRDYDLWSMRMEQYLTHTDYAFWEVIIIGDSPVPEPPAVGLDKTYDRFQKLISQLELNGEVISQEDENMKLLRSLPPAWNNIALIMRNKPHIETLSMDDLYNNLKEQPSASSYADDVMFYFFTSQSNTLHLDNEDLEQIDTDDLEEMDLKWQVAMITMRVKKFMQRTGRNLNFNGKESVGFDQTKVECYNCHRRRHFARECRALTNQGNRSADNEGRVVPVETPTSALVLEETMKEKDDLKEKLTKFEESSKNLTKLINSQMSANDKTGLGYDSQLSENEMPKCKIFKIASDSSVSEIDEENNQAKDRTSVNENESITSKSSEETREEPKTVRSSAPIVEDWESDSEDEFATKSGQVMVNVAKQNSAPSTSTAKPKVNTDAIRLNVNVKSSFFKPHFPKRRHFNQRSATKTNTFSRKINTATGKNVTTTRPKAVINAAEGKKDIAVKTSAGCAWRPKITNSNNVSKDISGSWISKRIKLIDPQGRLKIKEFLIVDAPGIWLATSHFLQSIKRLMVALLLLEAVLKEMKGIKREFSAARTPQQNGVAERKNRTLIEAARTMLVDSLLPTIFWAEAVNTACDVQNRDLVTKPHNKTPYEFLFVSAENQSNGDAGIQTDIHVGQASQEKAAVHKYILLPFISSNPPLSLTIQSSDVNASDQPIDVNSGDQPRDVNAATGIFDGAFDDRDLGAEADTNNLDSSTVVSPIPTTIVHKDNPKEQIIGDPNLNNQTRRMINFSKETAMVSFINRQKRTNHKDFQNCLSACFLSQIEPNKVIQALKDPSWIEAMQEELLQFKLQDSAFIYGKIEEEMYVCQPPRFEDPNFPDKVFKVKKALYGLHQALRAWKSTTGGCQFLGCRLISSQHKKQTVVANSTTEAEYVDVSKNCALLVLDFQTTPQMVIISPCLTDKKQLASPGQTTTGKDFSNPLMDVNPTIYVSCVKQFWATVKVQKVNDQEQIQALVDKMKVIITEGSIRSDFHFDDAKRTACLLKEEIFEGLARMSTMASAIIHLADNQKFNFSKYIFHNMVKILEGGVKFYLFPRFLQVFLDKQVEGMARHKEMYVISSHTKKIFTNMRRIGAGFSRKPQKPRRKQRKEAEVSIDESEDEDYVLTPFSDPLPSGEDSSILNELMVFCTSLQEQSRSRGLRRLKRFGSVRRVKSPTEKDGLGAQEDASKQERMIEEIDQNVEIALDDETQGSSNDDEMFGVDDLAGEKVVLKTTTGIKDSAAPTTDVTEDEITMAQALAALKSVKPKVVVQEQEMSTTIPAAATKVTTAIPTPRAKGIIFHGQKKSQKPTVSSSKDKGKAKMIEPEVPLKKKEQIRIDKEYARKLQAEEQESARLSRVQQDEEANNSWDNTQAMIDADRLLAKRLQAREREEFSEVQKARLEIRKVNDFVAMDSEAQKSSAKESQESSTKRTAEHHESDISKKQKVDENVKPVVNDSKELKSV
uniref:CCHC-type domain-containing protein n=1 Tax=Tanacetum cinerariifolium TaxID=118510 RepID=A0A6L2MH89_TANCI|nr:hypothetical protein [Tanacetum cinerariifolium]